MIKKTLALFVLTAALTALTTLLWPGVANAQLYKSVGVDGKIIYSDTPPVRARQIQKMALPSSPNLTLPANLDAISKKTPVMLYTAKNCPPCDAGRTLLTTRGIPHTEKTVNSNEDIAVFRQIGGATQLPLLVVGTQQLQGFESETWDSALTAANYPMTNKLPPSYQPAAAVAAAPPKAAVVPKALPQRAARKSNPPSSTTAAGNAPPGFQF